MVAMVIALSSSVVLGVSSTATGGLLLTVNTAGGVDGSGIFSGESYDAMALIILASQAAGSTDRAAIAAASVGVVTPP